MHTKELVRVQRFLTWLCIFICMHAIWGDWLMAHSFAHMGTHMLQGDGAGDVFWAFVEKKYHTVALIYCKKGFQCSVRQSEGN